jgi:CRP-like cAMP-binding protein
MPDAFEITRFLRETRLFEGLNASGLAAIARAASCRDVGAGGLLFRQGATADELCLLRLGQVKLLQRTPYRREVLLGFVNPGEAFGSASILPNQSYSVSAVSVRWCQVVAWRGKAIAEIMQSYPRIVLNALRELHVDIEELRLRYRELATQGVEQRLAQLLLRLAIKSGPGTGDGMGIGMPLSRRDLAELTGTTLYTVSRILSAWARAGLVDTGRQWVAILCPQRLAAIAAQGPEKKMRQGNGRTQVTNPTRPELPSWPQSATNGDLRV